MMRHALLAAVLILAGCGKGPLNSDGGPGTSGARSPVAGVAKVGTRMPDFSLADQAGRSVTAAELAASGGAVLLFVPGAAAPTARPAYDWAARHRDLLRRDGGAEVLVVTGSTVEDCAAAAKAGNLRFAVLADPEFRLAAALGISRRVAEEGQLWTIVSGGDGRVHLSQAGLANVADVVTALEARPGAPKESVIPVLR
jgi:peroxiredoxin